MAVVFSELAIDALTIIGQLGTGQTMSPEQASQCLRFANRMIQKWSTQRYMLYNVETRQYALTSGTQDYTVGPTGAMFTAPRPVFIQAAQIALPGSSMDVDLNILDNIKWGAIRDKGATCSANGLPQDIWVEYRYPNFAFHIWPKPGNAADIKLAAWELLQQFATIFDELSLPPGYEEAIVKNLAMYLASAYDMTPSPELTQEAADGLIEIQKINAQSIGGALGPSQVLSAPNVQTPVGGGGGQ